MTALYAALSGLFIWTAQFAAIYGVTAVACARGYEGAKVVGVDLLSLFIAGTTLIALALNGLVLVGAHRRSLDLAGRHEPSALFLTRLAYLISALSIAAIAWNGLPALILYAC